MPTLYYYNNTTSSWEPAIVGETGATGAQGATGPAGSGSTGATGIAGNDGATGATGPAGTNGSVGATGASGPGFVWQGAWNPAGSYIGGQDVVSYAGSSYIKIGDGNSGSPPPDDPVRWSVMAEEGAVGETGATGAIGNTLLANLDANGFFISNAANITANYFVGVATDVVVEAVNDNYSYHMAFVTGSGDTTLHMDNDDNLQYNPADGLLTANRVDVDYLSVDTSVISNLIPFSNVTQDLGNNTNRWKDIYLANSTIYLGDATLSANGNSIVVDSITVTNGNVGTVGNIASINLDGSSSNVLYGNGAWAPAAAGSGYPNGFIYTLDDRLVSGEFEVNNTDPASVTTISINPTSAGNIELDTLMNYLNDKNVVVTLADTSGNQASYTIGSIDTFTTDYNGYKAVFTKQWGDDPGFSKIAFYKSTATATAITQTDTDDDEFTVNIDSGSSDLLGLAIIYTSNDSFIPTNANLTEYFEYFVDNILLPATNIADIRTFFYDQIINTTPLIAAWGEDPWDLEFYTNGVNSIYTGVSSTTGGTGTGFTADIIIAGDGSYRIKSFTGGSGYQVYDNITFSGTDLGGSSPTNDFVLEVASVDGTGSVLTFGETGLNAAEWPTNSISDGGSDIYDDGNYLKTNLQSPVPYSDGILQNTGAFDNKEWFVGYAYGQFVFFGDNTGDPVNNFGTYGETGADGGGERVTGDLSPVQYFDLNVNSVLDYTPGMTLINGSYQISFDNGGIDTNGVVFDQGNVNTITTTAGDLYISAYDDVRVRPADLLQLKGGDKTTPGSGGGYVSISGGQGSQAVTTPGNENNAGTGGDVEIYGGTAGWDGGNTSLGQEGGRVYIEGGSSSGNNNGGEIRLMGGNPSGTGTRGNIVFNLDYDTVFKYDGSIIFPTKTVDLHNGGNQNAQLLQFGNPDLQAVITGPTPNVDVSAQRLIIQGQRGNGIGEGGDVYLWAGDADTNGGDIKIYAGDADISGYGGYINLDGGSGVDGGGQLTLTGGYSSSGQGGQISITPGYSGNGNGATLTLNGGQASGDGGPVNITAGYGGGNGGAVTIQGGQSALGLPGYGNVLIGAGASTWTFDNEGNLVVPQNGEIKTTSGNITIVARTHTYIQGGDQPNGYDEAGGNVNVTGGQGGTDLGSGGGAGGTVNISAGQGGTANGNIAGQGGTLLLFGGSGGLDSENPAFANSGGNVLIRGGDGSYNTDTEEIDGLPGNVFISGGNWGNPGKESGNVIIQGYDGTTEYNWIFDNAGNLTLPGNSFAVNYANGTQVPIGGGGGNTGNVTFDDVTVQGDNSSLNLSAGADFTANLAYLQVRAGDTPSHIHLDTGNNEVYDLLVGDDQNYVQVSSTGNIIMSAYDSNTNQYIWTLDYNGNMTLAGGNSVIFSTANNSLDPTNPNVSTMTLTPDANYNSQVLVLDPTAPGHIHLRAYAFSNIDEPAANIFLGGENTAFEITSGANNKAVIHSGGLAWTFSNTDIGNVGYGVIDFPGESYLRSNNDTINIQSYDTANGVGRGIYVGTGGGLYFWDGNSQSVSIQQDNTAANITAVGNTSITANTYTWTFDSTGNLVLPSTPGGNLIKSSLDGPIGVAAINNGNDFPAQLLSIYANGTAATAVSAGANNASITSNINGSMYVWTFDNEGTLFVPGEITGYPSASPAPSLSGFDSLSAISLTLSGTGTAISASSGNILTNEVTGTKFNFLNGLYTAILTGQGATANYQLNLPANAGSASQILSTDGSGNLSWTNNILGNGPAFSAYQSSAGTALNSGSSVKLNFDAEDFDTNNNFDLSTNRFTPTVAGYYQVTMSTMVPSTSIVVSSSIYKNGSKVCDGQAGSGGGLFYGQSLASKLIYMNGTTDYLEAYAIASSSVTTFNSAAGVGTYFQASMVRGA